jgi:hypothetical protein
MAEKDIAGSAAGLAGFLLSLNTMLTLERNGDLGHQETLEIIEQALLNLETHELLMARVDQETSRAARELLQTLRTLLGPPE